MRDNGDRFITADKCAMLATRRISTAHAKIQSQIEGVNLRYKEGFIIGPKEYRTKVEPLRLNKQSKQIV
jgi:hypothetical protein